MKEKPEIIRKQFLSLVLVFCMFIVGGIWVLGVTHKVSYKKAQVEITESDKQIKPLTLLIESAKNAYNNISASVADAPSLSKIKKEVELLDETKVGGNKVVDLIPVEYIEE